MDADTLSQVMGGRLSRSRYQALAPAFDAAMTQARCTTPRRAAMWCAQVCQESGGLQYMGELWGDKPTKQQARYDPPTDLAAQLGNTRKGDGYTYRGAGPIQVTGKAHFRSVSAWAHALGYVPSPTYFVEHPDELRGTRYGFLGAVWYWTVARPTLNTRADAGDVRACTKLINGGYTHLAERQQFYDRAIRLGDRLLPSRAAAAPAPAAVPAAVRPALFAAAVEDPVNLDPTPMPADRNSDPRTWPQVVRVIPFDIAGGWLGDCAIALTSEELGGRTVDRFGAYLQLASWAFDPPQGGTDVVLRPVNTLLSTAGSGAPLQRHWATPAYVAPKGARGLVINVAAPAGLAVAIGRHPTG